jgi:hypothetical protein
MTSIIVALTCAAVLSLAVLSIIAVVPLEKRR